MSASLELDNNFEEDMKENEKDMAAQSEEDNTVDIDTQHFKRQSACQDGCETIVDTGT